MPVLSILIPASKEKHLQRTIDDIFLHAEGDIEVLVALDNWEDAPIVHIAKGRYIKTALGQRGATNALARISEAKYVMKIDAHCSFSQGFDIEMIKAMDDRTIQAPYLLRLDEESWTPIPKPCSSTYCFDTDLVFQYYPKGENDDIIVETMCLQGSAWMITRENYWQWNISDESLGGWGGQAAELGIKAFLNGGRCITNKNAYYAHLFREKEEDFPYQRNKEHIKATLNELRNRYKNKSIVRLIEKFNYPANWNKEEVDKLK